jgi:hypothetical protein
MIELTIEQHSSALADPETPKRVLDPVSKEVFVFGSSPESEMNRTKSVKHDVRRLADQQVSLPSLASVPRLRSNRR